MNPNSSGNGPNGNNPGNPESYYQNSNREGDGASVGSGGDDNNYKSRRRSKKDNEGRNFK